MLRKVYFMVALLIAIVSCNPELFPIYDTTNSGYAVKQTFGQLVAENGMKITDYAVIQMPTTDEIKAFTNGTVVYRKDFHNLGNTLIIKPKTYFSSDTDYDNLEGLKEAKKVYFALGNLDEAEVKSAIQNRYTTLNNSNASQAAQNFIDGLAGNKEIDIHAEADATASTSLGKANGGLLYVAVFSGKPDAVDNFYNPLPYLKAAFPSGLLPSIDNQEPQISEVTFKCSENALMLPPTIYEVPASNTIELPGVLFKHLEVYAKIEDQTNTGGDNIAPYEFSYEINKISRDGTNTITNRVPVSMGRHLINSIKTDTPLELTALYDTYRSSPSMGSLWYKLHFDTTSPPDATTKANNYAVNSNTETLDISGYTSGEYEFVLKTRDAIMDNGNYATRTIYANIDNSTSAIEAANWGFRTTMGTETTEINTNGESGFLIIPGASAPLPIQTQITNAPTLTGNQAFKYSIISNGTPVAPISDAGLFPSGTNDYTGIGTNQNMTFSGEGLHEIIVWLDQDGDGVRQNTEQWRRMVIMTYELNVNITAENKRGATPYTNLPVNTLIAAGDDLKLTAMATGFALGHETSANYRWEVTLPNGTVENDTDAIWEKAALTDGGVYTAKAIVELFGAEFEATWTQTVVAATIEQIESICEGDTKSIAITLTPSPLPGGAQVTLNIQRPGNLANGNLTFADGSTNKTINASGTEDLRGATVSNAKDNIAFQVLYNGAVIGEENLSVCKIEILDKNKNVVNHLKVGLWENAYDGTFVVKNNPPAANNFVDLDERRFYIKITDHSKNTNAGSKDKIQATKIGIQDQGNGIIDAAGNFAKVHDDYTSMQLFETGNNTGIFESVSHLLVSPDLPIGDKPDDDLKVDDGNNHKKDDDLLNDRTHRSTIDGRMQFRYENTPGNFYIGEEDVCREAEKSTCEWETEPGTPCKLQFKVTVFNEPYEDVGYGSGNTVFDFRDVNNNGQLDPGESEPFTDSNGDGMWQAGEPFTDTGYGTQIDALGNIIGNDRFDFTDRNSNGKHDNGEACEKFKDLSSGSNSFSTGRGERGGIVTESYINLQIRRAQIGWVQACIKPVMVGAINYVDAPKNAAGIDIIDDGFFTHPPSADDEKAVVDLYGSTASTPIVEVFFVATLPGDFGYAIIPDVSQAIPGLLASVGDKTFVFIGPENEVGGSRQLIAHKTLAHELGHALTNQWDPNRYGNPDNPQYVFFPKVNTSTDNNYNSERRLLKQTAETHARKERTFGSLACPGGAGSPGCGNRILVDF